MLLAIDCGNTNIVFGLYDQLDQLAVWRMDTHPLPCCGDMLASCGDVLARLQQSAGDVLPKHAIEGIAIASVVPDASVVLRAFAAALGHSPLMVGEAGTDIGIEIDVPNPSQVGPDRLVNAAACYFLDAVPAIVVDFGTATTFDVVLEGANGARYAGGVIAPGVNLSVAALSAAAARLPDMTIPEMNIQDWQAGAVPALGTTTEAAMRSGILWGYVGLVDGILDRLQSELGIQARIIATGGLALLYTPHIKALSEIHDDLTLLGLCRIFAMNMDK